MPRLRIAPSIAPRTRPQHPTAGRRRIAEPGRPMLELDRPAALRRGFRAAHSRSQPAVTRLAIEAARRVAISAATKPGASQSSQSLVVARTDLCRLLCRRWAAAEAPRQLFVPVASE